MIVLALLLFAAALAHIASSLLKISSIPLFIISGILLSVSGVIPDTTEVQHTLLLGLTFLVFIAGTELSPDRTDSQLKTSIKVGVFQFFILGILSFLIARVTGIDLIPALYLGLAIAASSTLVVVRILQKKRQVYEPFGRLVLGVLLVQDLIAILFISLLSSKDFTFESIMLNGVYVAGIAVLSWIFQKRLIPYIFISLKLDEETLLLVSLAVLFSFTFIAHILGLPFIVGAFFGGFALSPFPVHGIVQSQLSSLSDFFVAIFFVSLGTTLMMPSDNTIWLSIGMIALVIVFTPLIVLFIAERAGLTTRGAFEAGLLLAQTSEFSLVIGLIGFESGHINQQLLSVIALVTVVTMITTPFLATDAVTWKLTKLRPYLQLKPANKIPENHILILGCGSSIQKLLTLLDQSVLDKILVIDHDPGVLKKLKEKGLQVARGDAADFRVLNACGAKNALLTISTISNMRDNEHIVKFLSNQKVIVRVLEDHDAATIRKHGGIPVLSSHLAAEEVLQWIKNDLPALHSNIQNQQL
jgi:Kef-type K+ transport system membrane component KefB